MKFVLQESAYSYWWPVHVDLPNPDKPGRTMRQSFEMKFTPLQMEESAALSGLIAMLPVEEQTAHQYDEILKVCTDWRGVTDENGVEVPFSRETLMQGLQRTWFVKGVKSAYLESLLPTVA